MPGLNQLALSWQGPEFQVLTVNVDPEGSENLELSKKYLTEAQISLPTHYDSKGQLNKAFGVKEYPRHFLGIPEGKIIWEATGAYRWNDRLPAIRCLN